MITGSSAGAVKAFEETATAADRAGGSAAKSIESAGGRITGAFKGMIGAGLALGGAFAGFEALKGVVGGATSAFGDQQQATALLNQAMQNTSQKWTPALTASLNAANDKLLGFGDTSAQTAGALQTLVLRGVPAQTAISDLSSIAGLAATKHLSLADAAEQVTKAASGRMSPALKELGITLPKGVTGVTALQDILGQVAPKVAGAAGALSRTLPGAMDVLKAGITDKVMVPIGGLINKGLLFLANNVMPIVVKAFTNLSTWFTVHKEQIEQIAGIIGKVLGTAWQVLANTVLVVANIIGMVVQRVVVIVEIAVGIIQAVVNRMGVIFNIVAGVIQTAVGVITTVIGWIAGPINAIIDLVSGPVGTAFGIMKDIVSGVVNGIVAVIGHIVDAIKTVISWVQTAISWFQKLLGAVTSTMTNMSKASPAAAAWVQAHPGQDLPASLQGHAAGGFFTTPHVATIAEVPEFVMNVPQMAGLIRGAQAGGGGGTVINLTVNTTPQLAPETIVNMLRRYMQRNGSIPIRIA